VEAEEDQPPDLPSSGSGIFQGPGREPPDELENHWRAEPYTRGRAGAMW